MSTGLQTRTNLHQLLHHNHQIAEFDHEIGTHSQSEPTYFVFREL